MKRFRSIASLKSPFVADNNTLISSSVVRRGRTSRNCELSSVEKGKESKGRSWESSLRRTARVRGSEAEFL